MAYNRNIPAATDLISNSQSQIQGNFQALDSGTTGTGVGFSRNHVTITDATNGGLHHRVDYYQNVVDPTISGLVSSIYPKAGTEAPASSQLFYRNASAIYHLSPIKAWGYSSGTTAGTGIISSQSSNVTSVARSSTGTYVVTIPASVLGSADYAVLVTSTRATGGTNVVGTNYSISSDTSFTITTIDPILNSVVDVDSFSFIVIQI